MLRRGFAMCSDCDDSAPGAHAVPAEVTDLVSFGDTLSWTSSAFHAGPATVHDVVRGSLSRLDPGTTKGKCFASDVADPWAADPATPPQRDGYWYLVRGRNGCGPGSYGVASDGVARDPKKCPQPTSPK
jgi:hypothetical protein